MNTEFKENYLRYFDEYIKAHAKEPIGIYELTSRAINYCQEKLNLPGRLPVNETKWKE